MKTLKINLKNCYGIQSLEKEFDFDKSTNAKPRVYAIYAPNGTMKTSFSKTFEALSKGKTPKEERYNYSSTYEVKADNVPIASEAIYVLKAELDISADSPSITNILVNPEDKARYDALLVDLDKLKSKLIKAIAKPSGFKHTEIEKIILQDWKEENFATCIQKIRCAVENEDLSFYTYNKIFDSKALAVLESKEFTLKAEEFNRRYQELFEQEGSIYQKGVFNPNKAETSFNALIKQGFFAGGHRVHLRGDNNSISKEEFGEKLRAIHAKLNDDADLKKIKDGLAKNAQTDALAELIENLSSPQFEGLLESLKSENQDQFRRQIWTSYIKKIPDADVYLAAYESSKEELLHIENNAAQSAPRWERAVNLFNNRFVDMPFELKIPNQAQAVLGRQTAVLNFIFKDDPSVLLRTRDNVRTSLSQGERRALDLLYFIFDVEERIMNGRETIFILDDVADSFDYKNKHAIIQYLRDLTEIEFFYQIILTHNFDFFRALTQGNGGFVHRARCLMANRGGNEISLTASLGVSNYIVNVWKPKIMTCKRILYATIPFARNLREYTTENYSKDAAYLKLTSLLHWKSDTNQITVGDYLAIYNQICNSSHAETCTEIAVDVLFSEAEKICCNNAQAGLDLENKVLLSIATRMRAEKFLTEKIRKIKSSPEYWFHGSDQFRGLMNEYKLLANNTQDIRILEKVGITVSSNIHLNSFMYEPILDLTIEHLVALYKEVSALHV